MKVERVDYEINWKGFEVGSSFFIPCLDPPNAWKEILPTLKRLRYSAARKVVIEDGVRGLRVWRINALVKSRLSYTGGP
jgi:hypothetical protein